MNHRTSFISLVLTLVSIMAGRAATYTLDDSASPISAVFDSTGGRLTVTMKSDGFVWKNPETSGGSTLTIGTVTQTNTTTLSANATSGAAAVTLTFQLVPATGELSFTMDGGSTNLGGGVVYPYPFFPTDGSGFAVVPVDSGYVVPTTVTTFSPPSGQRGMEWFGGTDGGNSRAWLALVDTPDDYTLKVKTGTFGGTTFLSTAPNWEGSNNNTGHTAGLLSYPRKLRYHFLSSGGYVSMAKQFRQQAQTLGWLKTFAQKQQDSPSLNLDQFIGSPICYLWGDGRSTALLDAMKSAGISKAHIQVSANHVDQQKNFPATNLADNGWFDAVRSRGYTGGFYDIYAATRTAGTGGSPYDGFYYLWPGTAYTDWAIIQSNGAYDSQHTISAQMASTFAGGTRLPAHLSRFNLDACFFDVVCAVDLTEDYDTTHGHFATRSLDRTNRFSLLNTAYANATKKLLTGTEQGRSWAVPTLHWSEGKFWLGALGTSFSDGSFNDNSYPQIMVDVQDPTSNSTLGGLYSDGYSAPLWDLVFHDCLVATVHWQRCHNKFLYGWDHADRWAMLRGQAPLLNLTYAGAQGLASRAPNTLTDAGGNAWTSRWTVMGSRFVQTFNTVCAWHGQIGKMEMISHARLTSDRTVQMSEFSNDGGFTGKGIVVNFGTYDGAHGLTGSTWTGTQRGQSLSVPAASYQTYSWSKPKVSVTNSVPGTTQLSFDTQPLLNYTLQASNDLLSWTALTTFYNSGAGTVTVPYSDVHDASLTRRFYRVTMP